MKMLAAENLTVRYGIHEIVKNVSFCVEEGQWFMLVGPNGAGKSTILNALSGGAAYTGNIRCMGKNIRSFSRRELAKTTGILSQGYSVGYGFTVKEVVALGRYAYRNESPAEKETHIRSAMEITGISHLADKSVLHLSGGELQRTFLAQVFAQDPKILILDEPTNHLDLIYQKHVFEVVQKWLAQGNRAVISVVHDLSLVQAFGTHAMLMDRGHSAAQGKVADIFADNALNRAYGMDVRGWMLTMLQQWEVPTVC